MHSDTVAHAQLLLYNGRERRHLGGPARGVVFPEAGQQLLEHRVELGRRARPLDDRIAEPEQTLRAPVRLMRKCFGS